MFQPWYIMKQRVLIAVSRLIIRSNLKSDIDYSGVKKGNVTVHIGT